MKRTGEGRGHGYPVMFGDVARGELVERLDLPSARAVILTMDDPVLTVRLTRRLRGMAPDLTIVATHPVVRANGRRARHGARCR